MVLGIIGARATTLRLSGGATPSRPLLEILNPQGGGLAIHGAIIGATLATLIYTRRYHLSLLTWLDICLPTMLLGQAIGQLGQLF